jgi:hypothetical protein
MPKKSNAPDPEPSTDGVDMMLAVARYGQPLTAVPSLVWKA